MDQALLDKNYTKEELKALPRELRLEVIGYQWAQNKLVAYSEKAREGPGFNIEFATAKELEDRCVVAFDLDTAELYAVQNMEDARWTCWNHNEVKQIIQFAKNYRVEEKPVRQGIKGWLLR